MSTDITPLPWWRDEYGFIASGSSADTYQMVASTNCSSELDIDEREANLEYILRACNSYRGTASVLENVEYLCLKALDEHSKDAMGLASDILSEIRVALAATKGAEV